MLEQRQILGSGWVGRGRLLAINKSEVPGIGYPLEVLGKSVKTIGVINQAILLPNLSNDCLVLRRFGGLIHTFFPLLKTVLRFFRFSDDFLISRINCFFGLYPRN